MALHALAPSSFLQSVSLSFTKAHPKFVYKNRLSRKTQLSSKVLCLAHKHSQENDRPLANFRPTIWKDTFDSTPSPLSELETYDKLKEEMKDRVKEMLIASRNDPVEEVVLINFLCRLGVSYHFETEIGERLNHIFEMKPNLAAEKRCDLYTTALLFRVFRQHGFKVSSGVFNKFKDLDGKFKESLTSDVRGMLSLYEATHLRLHGEDILEEALSFTTGHLKSMAADLDQKLAKHINDALEQPLHMGVPRIEAYKFISFYQHDESKNDTLLEFAKLDFNRVQLLHQKELRYLTGWMKGLNFGSTYSYSRDRTVEMYLWSVAQYFEPRYSRGRIIFTKVFLLVLIIDDTYDAYGTLEELQRFTDAIERWDINAVSELPDYMKPLYSSLLHFVEELNNELAEEGGSYSVSLLKDMMKEVVRAYFEEAQWFREGYVPPFDERMRNALMSASKFLAPASAFIGMGDIAVIDAFEWLRSEPKILVASITLCRLICDTASSEAEKERGHVVSVVEAYMNEFGASRKETAAEFKKMIANGWKDINEECMRPTIVPRQLLNVVVNILRLVEVFYKKEDGLTNPEYSKDIVTELFVDPIPV